MHFSFTSSSLCGGARLSPLPFPLPAVSVGLLLVLLMQARAYVSLEVFSGRLFHEVLLSRDVTHSMGHTGTSSGIALTPSSACLRLCRQTLSEDSSFSFHLSFSSARVNPTVKSPGS